MFSKVDRPISSSMFDVEEASWFPAALLWVEFDSLTAKKGKARAYQLSSGPLNESRGYNDKAPSSTSLPFQNYTISCTSGHSQRMTWLSSHPVKSTRRGALWIVASEEKRSLGCLRSHCPLSGVHVMPHNVYKPHKSALDVPTIKAPLLSPYLSAGRSEQQTWTHQCIAKIACEHFNHLLTSI